MPEEWTHEIVRRWRILQTHWPARTAMEAPELEHDEEREVLPKADRDEGTLVHC